MSQSLLLLGLAFTLGCGWWPAPSVPIVSVAVDLSRLRPPPVKAAALAVVALLVGGVGLVQGPVIAVLVGAVVVGGLLLRRRGRSREAGIEAMAALPESLELCIVTLGAGGTIADCLRTLATAGTQPARSTAEVSLQRVGRGALLDDALLGLQTELGPAFQPLSGALRLASEQGGSVGALLDRLAMEANTARRRAGEVRARRLSVALVVPLVVFSLPAVLIGAIVPLALVGLRQVS